MAYQPAVIVEEPFIHFLKVDVKASLEFELAYYSITVLHANHRINVVQDYYKHLKHLFDCPVGWGCRIHRQHLCRGIRPQPTGYDTKQSDSGVPIILELWGMRSTPSLPLLPGSLWLGVVAPDKRLIYGLNRTNIILMLNWIVWIRTVWLNRIGKMKCFWQLNRTYIQTACLC